MRDSRLSGAGLSWLKARGCIAGVRGVAGPSAARLA